MWETVERIHKALGIQSTWKFVLLFALLGAVVSGLAAWVVDAGYKNSAEYKTARLPKPEAATRPAQNVAASSPSAHGISTRPRPPRSPSQPQSQNGNSDAAASGNGNFQNTGSISQTVAPCALAIVGNMNNASVNCAPPSGTELAKFGSGTAVQIVENSGPTPIPIATGFWLNTKGYIATCLHSLDGKTIMAQTPMPPLLGNTITVLGGDMMTGLQPIAEDSDADIAILHVVNSPFERSMHGFSLGQKLDDKGQPLGAAETTQEQYWVPEIADNLAHDGEDIIKVSFTQDHAIPVASYDFGHIVRMGVDQDSTKEPYRIFTSFEYKGSDCGSPIINNAKIVIGMMHGPNGEGIPSTYIVELLKKAE